MRETKSIQIAGTREKGKESETHARALVGLRLLLKVALEVEGEVGVVGHRGERERERKRERTKGERGRVKRRAKKTTVVAAVAAREREKSV